jgi:hypothetical protein
MPDASRFRLLPFLPFLLSPSTTRVRLVLKNQQLWFSVRKVQLAPFEFDAAVLWLDTALPSAALAPLPTPLFEAGVPGLHHSTRPVYIAGFPGSRPATPADLPIVTAGVLSRDASPLRLPAMATADARIAAGCSGGPAICATTGRLLGLVSSYAEVKRGGFRIQTTPPPARLQRPTPVFRPLVRS